MDDLSPSARKHFLLRLEPSLYAALEAWAAQEMRSVNGQIEWLLREAIRRRGGGGAAAGAPRAKRSADPSTGRE
jgi:hypothetical protein